MHPFTENVIRIIKNIPVGTVMTYGQVAAVAGNPRGARQVVRILHTMSGKHQLPWHRVINAKGEISFTGSEQRDLLELEGIVFSKKERVDLSKYRWEPSNSY
ncbi:MGMT family protein [Sporosarcina sp. HYO08]|uniref:MGMT family protein n=1 Tax=Sporosarcina sp. HYO08 TaxID=1759557 RepID=UPI000798CE94|nr:MGMT family protein [Sporosarcina sp. HYO08]KXH80704.1 hypothetical protein AU377_08130 [Sporosarcina sp. HYO08]